MRIALCLSGYPRFWDRLDLSDYGEVSIFIHSWTTPTISSCLKYLYPNSLGLNYLGKADLNALKPCNMILESFRYKKGYFGQIYSKFRNCEGRARESVLPMFYSMQKSIQLALDYPKKFDIIVRSRFDIKWLQKLSYVKNDFVNIPNQFHYYGICDQFAYGSPEIMEKYSKVFNYLETYPNVQINPEIILKDYLHINKIPINLIKDEFCLMR